MREVTESLMEGTAMITGEFKSDGKPKTGDRRRNRDNGRRCDLIGAVQSGNRRSDPYRLCIPIQLGRISHV